MSLRPPSKTSSATRTLTVEKTPMSASSRDVPPSAKSSLTTGKSKGGKPSTSSMPDVPEKKEWELPALSVGYKPKLTESEFQKMKKRTIRRHAPPGEDIKCIKEIIKTVKRRSITVQEFVSLIAPSTADKGETLRLVMQEDLNAFRKLAKKVYDTITQDNSDVLLNQQLQLAEYYKEKKALLHDKMMRHIAEIYMMIPDFDFDRYGAQKDAYLAEMLPIPREVIVDPEEYEIMKRHTAYHRLLWLRSEGERLNEENNRLKQRLNQLKRIHKEEQIKMIGKEKEAEAKKLALEAKEAEKEQTLEMLNESLEKSIIDREKQLREEQDSEFFREPALSTRIDLHKETKSKKKKKRPAWNEQAALEAEIKLLSESKTGELVTASKKMTPASARETSPFHYSPPRSPQQRSPFHYPKSPQAAYMTPPRAPDTTVQAEATEKRFGRRTSLGPRDSWGGFY